MAKIAITISPDGIQTLSFFGNTEEQRRMGLQLYTALEEELRIIDQLIKDKFSSENNEKESH